MIGWSGMSGKKEKLVVRVSVFFLYGGERKIWEEEVEVGRRRLRLGG